MYQILIFQSEKSSSNSSSDLNDSSAHLSLVVHNKKIISILVSTIALFVVIPD